MKAIENLKILPFTRNFKQNANARKFFKPLTFNAHNLKTTQSRCNLKTDLNRTKVEHFSDMILLAWQNYLTKTQNFDH